MKKIETQKELRPEYDLKSLRIRKLGKGRNRFGDVVRLEPDIAEVFSNAAEVNGALRSLIKIASKSTSLPSRSNGHVKQNRPAALTR